MPLLALSVLLGCAASGVRDTDRYGLRIPPRLVWFLDEMDRYSGTGKIREAIDVGELALVDFHDSTVLRDRLAELRSIRQLMYQRDRSEAEREFASGQPEAAIAILRAIDDYGDERMIQRATARRHEIAITPAAYTNREAAETPP